MVDGSKGKLLALLSELLLPGRCDDRANRTKLVTEFCVPEPKIPVLLGLLLEAELAGGAAG